MVLAAPSTDFAEVQTSTVLLQKAASQDSESAPHPLPFLAALRLRPLLQSRSHLMALAVELMATCALEAV